MQDEEKNEAEIASLLRLAGRRPRVPDDRAARVRAAVHAEWQAETQRRSRRRLYAVAAMLATVAIASLLAFVVRRAPQVAPQPSGSPAAPVFVAKAEVVQGSVVARTPQTQLVSGSMRFAVGHEIEVAEGSVASFDWQGRASLRVAGGSVVRFDAPASLTLARGAVYFSSTAPGAPMTIRTPHGDVHDIGTQFEVRVDEQSLRVRVREGKVDLAGRHVAEAGTELRARGDEVTRSAIAVTGAEWEWTLAAAPPIPLEGNLGELLRRVAREKGLTLRFADPSFASMTVHGNVPLAPDEVLEAATTATGLRYRIAGDTLVVEKRP